MGSGNKFGKKCFGVIALSLMIRNASKDHEKFSCKMVAAMRNGFGGHSVKKK